jgi:hypothetical protein
LTATVWDSRGTLTPEGYVVWINPWTALHVGYNNNQSSLRLMPTEDTPFLSREPAAPDLHRAGDPSSIDTRT